MDSNGNPSGASAVSLSASSPRKNGRFGGHNKSTPPSSAITSTSIRKPLSSLIHLCRLTVVNNMERFPPESLGVLDEAEWSTMIRLKHSLTAPKSGTGGLDGTGRLTAAISDRFLASVEQANEHLSECVTADTLIWKDCVNRKFTHNGISRPAVLDVPWPQRLRTIETATQLLLNAGPTAPLPTQSQVALRELEQSPMNASLLKATGVGKTLKKICKRFQDKDAAIHARLVALLEKWKAMVAKDAMSSEKAASSLTDKEFNLALGSPSARGNLIDWYLLETQATSWRQLFAILVRREEARRCLQGKRISNIRKNLNNIRPKIVKVVPSNKNQSHSQQRILNHVRPSSSTAGATPGGSKPASQSGNSKINKLRQEAMVSSSRQHGRGVGVASRSPAIKQTTRTVGFAAAVAASATGKKMSFGKKRKGNAPIIMKSSGKRIRR